MLYLHMVEHIGTSQIEQVETCLDKNNVGIGETS